MMTAARQARLNSESGGGAWCPRQMIDLDHKLEEWLEVRLCSVFLSVKANDEVPLSVPYHPERVILIQRVQKYQCINLIYCLST